MVTLVFTKDLIFPRFSVKAGEKWEKRPENITKEGFKIGNGFAEAGTYLILKKK